MSSLEKISYYHLNINNLSTVETIDACKIAFIENKQLTLFFLNAHCFNISLKNTEYLQAIKHASVVLNDGIGIKIGAKLKGIALKENMNGTDFIPKLLNECGKANRSVFLLGGKAGVAERAKYNIEQKNPNITIVSAENGYFGKQGSQAIIDKINASSAEILIVGMGVPTQEIWLNNNVNKLANIKVAVAGGAILDFMAGEVIRAPLLIQKIGMEWFWRLALEPKRLFTRYIIGNITFLAHVFLHKGRK